MIAHRVGVAQVDSCAIAHEAFHTLHSHAGLVETREGSDFDFRLDALVAPETESRVGRVARVPEVVSSLHHLNVDALGVGVLRHLKLLVEPIVSTEER